MARRRSIHVEFKKLARNRAWGLAHHDGHYIEVDERLRGKKRMEIIVHECLHLLFPDASEKEIETKSIILTNTLWQQGYRATDNENIEPLQDGKM
jgi:hypothetical protein